AASVADCGSTATGTTGPCFTGVGPAARTATSSGHGTWTTRRSTRTPSAALALGWPGTLWVAISAPATVPPGPPAPPIEEQAGPGGLQDLIDVDIDIDLL
ncbi:unnamed protein product, partial [Ixodes pacificus]